MTVTFTDNADDESGFYVQRTTDAGQNWLQVGALNAPVPGRRRHRQFIDYSVVGSAVCYRIIEQTTYVVGVVPGGQDDHRDLGHVAEPPEQSPTTSRAWSRNGPSR